MAGEDEKEKLDYKKLGLKVGLEIHQQLDTGKLFCNCPSILRQDEPDFTIKRKLHAVAGETGSVDEAALFEAGKEKEFEYQGYNNSTCLVELDEEPCHEINQEALKISVQISLLLNCKIFPITQVMRKTVLDGSNTSGFQRTVLIARDGFVETSYGRVGIATVCLEEDSARIVSRSEKEKISVYRLDRLGIPLVEIATAADIKNPKQAKETALLIGEILRSCKVKRGIGTIRQDVNLSINGGKRIELKGFQDIKNIETAIENEVKRQKELVKQGKSIAEVRNVLPSGESEFLRPMPGAARMYPETDLPLLKISKDFINEAKKTLPKSKIDVGKELSKHGLNEEMIKLILKENKLENFKELLTVFNKPLLIAKMLVLYPKEIASKNKVSAGEIEKKLTIDVLSEILEKIKEGRTMEDDVKHVLNELIKGKEIKDIFSTEQKTDLNEVEEMVKKIMREKPGLSEHAYMGIVMKEFKGKVSGKDAMGIIKKYIR